MRREIVRVVALVLCVAMTGAVARAEEDRSSVDKDCLNIEALGVLDARGGYIRLEGQSLFLTSNVHKDTHAGYWFDIGKTPRRPSLVCDSLPGAWDVAVAGRHVVVCDYTKLLAVYEIRDRRWQQVAKLKMPSMTENVVIRGKLAYIANHVGGLTIVDISTPSKPAIVSNFNPHIDCDAIGLWHDCVILYGHWESRLVLVDVSDPAKPRETGVYQNAPKTFNQGEMAVDGGLAYCTTKNGLVIVNVADQANPKLVKAVDLNCRVSDVIVKAGYAFLAAGSKGVRVLDVSDTAAPVQVGCYKAGKTFAASQIAVQPAAGSETDYLIYVANSKGPATVLQFHAPAE